MPEGTSGVKACAQLVHLARRYECSEAPYEDPSVERELRCLQPHATSERFVRVWQWEAGDLAVWDNRSTMHCATGFDRESHVREMWRTTLCRDVPAAASGIEQAPPNRT